MAYWYVQASDEETHQTRELLVVAESEAQIETVLVRSFGDTFRIRYHYILSEVVQDIVAGFYEDFQDGDMKARRSVSTLRRAELSLFQEGVCLAENMTSLNQHAINLLVVRDDIPHLNQAMSTSKEGKAMLVYDMQGIQQFLTYSIHQGIRELLEKVVTIVQKNN